MLEFGYYIKYVSPWKLRIYVLRCLRSLVNSICCKWNSPFSYRRFHSWIIQFRVHPHQFSQSLGRRGGLREGGCRRRTCHLITYLLLDCFNDVGLLVGCLLACLVSIKYLEVLDVS